ncbi:hypothetical protein BH09MYX1_BH09MYX1_26330 [soil metagenome]
MARNSEESATTITRIRRDLARVPTLALVAMLPDGRELACPLGIAPVVVGRGADCDLIVDDGSVSQAHVRVMLTANGILVRDLESKNGTSIGGVTVREAFLPPSTSAKIGAVALRVRNDGEAADVPLWPGASFGGALGGSIGMRARFAELHRVAQTAETILLTGESGSGKEVLARAIHDHSPRADRPFVVFDAGAVAASIVESELFGHVGGAFTGASGRRSGILADAEDGTLFLDEIGELPLELQPKLLRALDAKAFRPVGGDKWVSFRARVIAATHRDLCGAVSKGTFRQDLYYRLAVFRARVPALREHKEDIELLVERFLAASVPARTVLDLPPGALPMLSAHDWPGNVRELRNAVARLVVFPDLDAPLELRGVEGEARRDWDSVLALPWRDARELLVDRCEASYLAAKLRENGGNVVRTASAMGVSRQLVHRLMTRHGLGGRS